MCPCSPFAGCDTHYVGNIICLSDKAVVVNHLCSTLALLLIEPERDSLHVGKVTRQLLLDHLKPVTPYLEAHNLVKHRLREALNKACFFLKFNTSPRRLQALVHVMGPNCSFKLRGQSPHSQHAACVGTNSHNLQALHDLQAS